MIDSILKYSQPYTLEELERYTDGSFEPAAGKAGIILLLTGEKVKNIGIILSGNVEISRQDYAGNRRCNKKNRFDIPAYRCLRIA